MKSRPEGLEEIDNIFRISGQTERENNALTRESRCYMLKLHQARKGSILYHTRKGPEGALAYADAPSFCLN